MRPISPQRTSMKFAAAPFLALLLAIALGGLATPGQADEGAAPPPPDAPPPNAPPPNAPPPPRGPRGPRGGPPPGAADMPYRAADADRNGALSAAEWKAFGDKLQKRFAELDKDGDGALSNAEMPKPPRRPGPRGEGGMRARHGGRPQGNAGRRGPPPPGDGRARGPRRGRGPRSQEGAPQPELEKLRVRIERLNATLEELRRKVDGLTK